MSIMSLNRDWKGLISFKQMYCGAYYKRSQDNTRPKITFRVHLEQKQ